MTTRAILITLLVVVLMLAAVAVVASLGLSTSTWQYWAILLTPVVGVNLATIIDLSTED